MKFFIKSFIIYLSSFSFHALVSAKESNKIEISVDAQMVEFGDPRSLLIELYGYNNLWADTSATIIRSSKIPVKSLPATISFDVMKNPHLLIKSPSVEDPSQARYYSESPLMPIRMEKSVREILLQRVIEAISKFLNLLTLF